MASTGIGNMGLFLRRVVTDDAIENHGSSVIFAFRLGFLLSFALNLKF